MNMDGDCAEVCRECSRGAVLHAEVAGAYGWANFTPQKTDETVLARLLTLNLQRATR